MINLAIRHFSPIARFSTRSRVATIGRYRYLYGDDEMPKGTAAARGRKRAAANDYEDDGFVVADEGSVAKKAKNSQPSEGKQVDNEGNVYWELSSRRRVTVSEYSGKPLISVREYYEKEGAQMPGRKGISLSLDQYNALMGLLPEVEAALAKMGQTVVRPNFEGSGSAVAGDEAGSDNGGKANHEATSEEDE
ncbi:putative rna polymerase ii transcriptional [Diplodia seriata]|uniref:Putative rna polymerase ii transcriptional n=1 Tax=Diplodia seriata TaxID=420778 RepID=A0A0G2FN66_9PEZI|nr:putative rna polymerase ii transcriptional [Diplodia seriata]